MGYTDGSCQRLCHEDVELFPKEVGAGTDAQQWREWSSGLRGGTCSVCTRACVHRWGSVHTSWDLLDALPGSAGTVVEVLSPRAPLLEILMRTPTQKGNLGTWGANSWDVQGQPGASVSSSTKWVNQYPVCREGRHTTQDSGWVLGTGSPQGADLTPTVMDATAWHHSELGFTLGVPLETSS